MSTKTITWDGDTTGKTGIQAGDIGYWYHISNLSPTYNELIGGTVTASTGDSGTITSENIEQGLKILFVDETLIVITSDDNVQWESVTFPTKGTYFIHRNGSVYISSLVYNEDTIETVVYTQDIHNEDKTLYTQYQTKWADGEYQAALNIIDNNTTLSSKAMTADKLNGIATSLLALENGYYNGVETYLNTLSTNMNALINEFTYMGLYNASTTYKIYNFVSYNDLIYMYINATPSSGNAPTDTSYWANIGLRGANGANGANINLIQNGNGFAWNSSTSYVAKDVVTYTDNGQTTVYVALQGSTNRNPSTSPSYWQVLMQPQSAEIAIQDNAPTEHYQGQIWFQTSLIS